MSALDDRSLVGAAAAESMEHIQTTSVDGRTYASIEDLLALVHANQQIVLETAAEVIFSDNVTEAQLESLADRAEGMAVILAQFDTTLHGLDDREGIESLCPGDFL
jgi:predicted glycosyl hydrolase (DUF1957 family)